MVDMTWQDFISQSADVSKSIMVKVAEETKKSVCEIFYASPGAFLTDIGTVNELLNGQRLLMDTLCNDSQKTPPPPSPPFSGGQCACQDYRISFQTQVENNTPSQVVTFVTKGPIGKVQIKPGDPSILGFSRGAPACPLSYFPIFSGNAQEIGAGRFRVLNFSASPIDGQSDICPSLPPSYPQPFVPPGALDRTVNFPVSPTINAPVSVKIVPTFIPVVNIFRPELNVDVGGIRVNVSLGGFTFSPNVALPVGVSVPSVRFPVTSPSPIAVNPPPSPGGGSFDPTEVLRQIERVRTSVGACCPPKPAKEDDPLYINKTTSSGSLEAGSIVVPDGTYKVTLLMTVIPQNAKSQYGGGEADIYFAGSAWFSSSASLGDRNPIDAQFKQFIPYNELQNSFVWSYNVGYKGIATVYYKEKRPT